jgi:DNA-binding beta-propeller fold protein YncE
MITKLIVFLIFTSFVELLSQTYIYEYSFGNFKDAAAFHVNPAGVIYAADRGTNEIYKLDTLGNVLKETGGYGWDRGAFDEPVDIFATTLNIYVADKNNHRIQRFDKDLNFISQLYTRNADNPDLKFGYPLACATSNMGDLFILDSENTRILKFDLFGNFNSTFGSIDAGSFVLSHPLKMRISQDNNIYVLDDGKIIVFDQYGNGLQIIDAEKKLKNINIVHNILTTNTDDEIFILNLNVPSAQFNAVSLIGYDLNKSLINSLLYKGKLYVLTQNEISVFSYHP